MKLRIRLEFLIPLAIWAVFALLALFKVTGTMEDRVYDLMLHWRKDPAADRRFLLLDYDDKSIQEIGAWPISREIMGDGLMLMKELGAEYMVFDIEYVNKSPRGINSEVLSSEIPEVFSNEVNSLKENILNFASALQNKQIPLKDAGSFAKDLAGLVDTKNETMLAEVQKIARDNDAYLAGAARFFGKAFLTINMQILEDVTVPPELKQFATANRSLKNVTDLVRLEPKIEISPTIEPIISAAKGLGFPNVTVDPDGTRRRIQLIDRYKDAYFSQLAFSPLLDLLGNPAVTIEEKRIVLKDAEVPGKGKRTITIPIEMDADKNGFMLINWPHKPYADDAFFRHLSFYFLIKHKQILDTVVYDLKLRDAWGYLDLYGGDTPLLEQFKEGEALRSAIMDGTEDPAKVADYIAGREAFLSELGAFLDEKPEDSILGQVTAVLEDPRLSADVRGQYEAIKADAPTYFTGLRQSYTSLIDLRKSISEKIVGSFAITGWTSTGTTDFGVNPFDSRFPNLGTHASVANTILNEDFLSFAPVWWSLGIAFALCGLIAFLLPKRKPVFSIIFGFAIAIAAFGVIAFIFVMTGVYLATLPVILSVFVSFIGLTLLQFLKTEAERSQVRNAFSHYLSGEVIRDILAHPEKLQLGGVKKNMTAVFTDIKGFSTVSEKMGPEDLVRLLNQYLTAMSDTILDLKGTIDKYEGDAIIAFFGAPIDLPDHAERACLSAVRMKKIERESNERFIAENLTPTPLLTRVGINTGDMVVGNMGTSRKMDYTIIGDAVNLAARLEGVNKQYGTWLLVSEDTQQSAGSRLITRKLDRVRVVGKSVPIRLFELVAEKGEIDQKTTDLIGAFDEALTIFEQRDWKMADAAFAKALAIVPDDGPSLRYAKLSKEYQTTPPPENWDGVFSLTVK